MDNDGIVNWILTHPKNYPGRQLESQPRTFEAYKPLDPRSQFMIVLNALGEYLREKMSQSNGVNLRGFGAFCFEIFSDTVKPAQLSNFDVTDELSRQRLERKHVHKIRPCFIPDGRLKATLMRYPGKEQVEKPKSQSSVYQKSYHMIFCNPTPIALACYLSKETVEDILKSFIRAVQDLTELDKAMTIDFKILRINIRSRDLSYAYHDSFAKSLNQTAFEQAMRISDKATKEFWTQDYKEKWTKSSLNQVLKEPNETAVRDHYEKGLALKIMSLDLNTSEHTEYSKKKK